MWLQACSWHCWGNTKRSVKYTTRNTTLPLKSYCESKYKERYMFSNKRTMKVSAKWIHFWCFKFNFMCINVLPACLSVPQGCLVFTEVRRCQIPWKWSNGSPCGCWGLNLGPLQEDKRPLISVFYRPKTKNTSQAFHRAGHTWQVNRYMQNASQGCIVRPCPPDPPKRITIEKVLSNKSARSLCCFRHYVAYFVK